MLIQLETNLLLLVYFLTQTDLIQPNLTLSILIDALYNFNSFYLKYVLSNSSDPQ